MPIKNILIPGGAGFIGSNLSLKLLSKGYNVTILDNLSPQIHGQDANKSALFLSIKDKVNLIIGDVANTDDWRKAIKNQDAIIQLAAETGTGQSMYEITKYTDVNIRGTALMLDLLTNEEHAIKKIIVASSRAIYGEGKYICDEHAIVYPRDRKDEDMRQGDFAVKCPICAHKVTLMPTDENSKIHPTSIYGISKQVQEQMVLVVGKSLKIPAIAFRYQNVFGPGQSLSNPYTGILSIFSTRIKNNNTINIFEDGQESRDFVYIDDVVDATILGLENNEVNHEAFNVGTGQKTSILTVANTLKSAYASNVSIQISGNYRLGDIRDNYADLTKIKSALGFVPKVDFETGINHFAKWVQQQDIQPDNYEKSIDEMKLRGLYK